MNNFLADVLPQEGGLVASPSRSYNVTIAIGGLLAALGLAAGLHSCMPGMSIPSASPGMFPGGC